MKPPSGVVSVGINPTTGLREPGGAGQTLEFFYQESQPPVGEDGSFARETNRPTAEVKNQIF